MYAVIDMGSMNFLNIKHDRLDVVADLVWLECAAEAVHIFDLYARPALSRLTDMEAMMLYKNATGLPKPPRMGEALRLILLELAERIPERTVKPHLVKLQADTVTEDDAGSYIYVPDSLKPAPKPGLFNAVSNIPRHDNETLIATQARIRPAKVKPVYTPPVAAQAPAAQPGAATGPIPPWGAPVKQTATITGPSNPEIVSPWLKK